MPGEHDQSETPDPTESEILPATARQATDRLAGTNRILVEARMLSQKDKLSPEQIKDVIERFQKFIGENGIRAAQAARACGYTGSVLSQWMGGTYRGDNGAVTYAVNMWMEREARRQQARRPKDYVPTWIAEDIRTYTYQADRRVMMAAIVAPAGTGKTKVLKALTSEMRGIYICCHKDMSVRELYLAIATELGWRSSGGTSGSIRRYIVGALAGTHRIIFLDEAHQLRDRIGYIRSIHDEAKVPIVMAGTDEILQFTNDRAHGRGQFSSRCIRYNAMDHVRNAEHPDGTAGGKDLFTIEEIEAFFKMKQIRLDRDSLKMLWALACLPSYGTLRLVENTIDTVFDTEPDLALVTRDHVIDALHVLVGGEGVYLQKLADRHSKLSGSAVVLAKAG